MAHHHFTRDDRVLLAKLKQPGSRTGPVPGSWAFIPRLSVESCVGAQPRLLPAMTSVLPASAIGSSDSRPTSSTASCSWRKPHALPGYYASTTAPNKRVWRLA